MTNEDRAFWLSWCIEEYAAANGKSSSEVAALFDRENVLSYLDENAEVLHTQGKSYILSEIDSYLVNNGISALRRTPEV